MLPDITIVRESGLRIVSAIQVNLDGGAVEHKVQSNNTSFVALPSLDSYLPRTERHCGAALRANVEVRDLGRVEHFDPQRRLALLEW